MNQLWENIEHKMLNKNRKQGAFESVAACYMVQSKAAPILNVFLLFIPWLLLVNKRCSYSP